MDGLPAVQADPGLLERVVANLVSNAVRHSPEGQPAVVAASALGPQVELRVVDRGVGIPERDRERVFRPFQRFGDRPAGAGVGLGLALSRGLAEAMGGTLEMEDTPGGGVTMALALPLANQRSPADPDVPADDTPIPAGATARSTSSVSDGQATADAGASPSIGSSTAAAARPAAGRRTGSAAN
jgi:two-component system sensor histidine kinase KdpD